MINIYKKLVIIFILTVSNISYAYESEEYKNYKEGLKVRFNLIKENSGLIDRGAIYAPREIKNKLYLISNEDLYQSGLDFINFLYSNSAVYKNLEFSEWILAANELLLVDLWLGESIAWGNLVIKMKILNDIINQIVPLLDQPGNLSQKEIKELISLVQKVRLRMPSKKAMYYIALRYYEQDTPEFLKSARIDYLVENLEDKSNRPEAVLANLRKIIYRRDNSQETFNKILKQESDLVREIKSFSDMYKNPVPWNLVTFSNYFGFFWDIYFKLLLIEEVGVAELGWSGLSEGLVADLLKVVDQRGESFWISEKAESFLEYENSREHYMKYLSNAGGLGSFRAMKAFHKKKSSVKMKKNRRRFFVVNALP